MATRPDEDPVIKLSRIAALNTVALVAQQLVVMLVSFLITPLLVATVGVSAFGIWQLIVKWSGYLMYFDGRAHENLKWAIARSAGDDDEFRRQALAACFRVWLRYMPLLLLGAVVFLYLITNMDSDGELERMTIFVTAGIMVLNAWLMGVQRFPEGILNGSNQGYRSAGLRLLVLVGSGVLSYLAVYQGYGLVGLALVQLATTLVLVIGYSGITRRHVPWIGFARPSTELQQKMRRTSFWFFMWSLVNFSLLQMEVLMLGFLGSAELVSRFVITFYAAQMISVIIETVITAVLPGIGVLIGQNNLRRVTEIRREGLLYCWWLGVSLMATVLVVNPAFVSLWVDAGVFAGSLENFLVAVLALQMILLRQDSLLINLVLEQKQKVAVTSLSILLVGALAVFLVPSYGIAGMCAAGILGRAPLMVLYPRIIDRFTGERTGRVIGYRGVLVSVAIVALAWQVSTRVDVESWLALIVAAAGIFMVALTAYYLLGMRAEQRSVLHARMRSVLVRGS